MFISSTSWQSKTALLLALGITSGTVFPILISTSATATVEPYIIGQTFPSSERVIIPTGSLIPVELEKAEKIIVTPDETAPVTVLVSEDLRSSAGTILIPAGSEIEGELQPTGDGTQFVAQTLRLRNRDQEIPIDAASRVFTERETLKKGTNAGQILKGAAIGAGAAAVISEIFGSIDVGEVLGGAGIGALAGLLLGGRREVEVLVINPDDDWNLALQSDLVLR
jgi:hypothetical protein